MRIFILFVLFGVFSCQPKQSNSNLGFYHWSQELHLTDSQQKILKQAEATSLYVRFFDIQWSSEYNAPIPESVLEVSKQPKINIVPTIFITENVMRRLAEQNDLAVIDLAKRTVKKINSMAEEYEVSFNKIQIDCDWTASSRDAYFRFLEEIKVELGEKKLSTTIRLHQIKYAERTGTPPADEGILMLYNMGKLADVQENNSIFDRATLKQYLYNFDTYKLPLHIALPAFRWALLFRDDELKQIIPLPQDINIDADSRLMEIEKNKFEVQEYFSFGNRYLYTGDIIRIEEPDLEDVDWAYEVVNKEIKHKPEKPEVIFYHIESDYVQSIPSSFYKQF